MENKNRKVEDLLEKMNQREKEREEEDDIKLKTLYAKILIQDKLNEVTDEFNMKLERLINPPEEKPITIFLLKK
jgi:hypothetical protein